MLFSIVPLFAYLLDGYYQKNIKAAVIQIILFVVFVAATFVIINLYGLTSILVIPIMIFILAFVRKKKSS